MEPSFAVSASGTAPSPGVFVTVTLGAPETEAACAISSINDAQANDLNWSMPRLTL
jgi:hypothetical protein